MKCCRGVLVYKPCSPGVVWYRPQQISYNYNFNIFYCENENCDVKIIFLTNCKSYHNCNLTKYNHSVIVFREALASAVLSVYC